MRRNQRRCPSLFHVQIEYTCRALPLQRLVRVQLQQGPRRVRQPPVHSGLLHRRFTSPAQVPGMRRCYRVREQK
ncbi:hypothetical protein TNCV_106301 [Trichonephila clavipes]|nr:hypothetical protein TNCV_106301 [Trichonephila clavipes]